MEKIETIIEEKTVVVKLQPPHKLEQWFRNFITQWIKHGYTDWEFRSKKNLNIIGYYYVKEPVKTVFEKYKGYIWL